MKSSFVVACFVFALPALSTPQSIAKNLGVPQLSINLKQDDFTLQSQLYGTQHQMDALLEVALTTILADTSDIESPLSLVGDVVEEEAHAKGRSLSPSEKRDDSRRKLLELMNHGSSKLILVTDESYANNDDGVCRPEHGESLSENWVLFLAIPNLSDHIFWVVIDRKNDREPYVYGFN